MVILLVFYYMLSWTLALDDKINLVAMDQHLTKLLTHPQPGLGEKLLSDSELFCEYLDEVSDLVDEKDPKGTELYQKFSHAGGLKFINTTYSPELVKKTYQFSEDDFEGLEGTIREIKSIWLCIEVLLNVTLPDSGEHFHEKMLANIRERELARGEVVVDNAPFPHSSSDIEWSVSEQASME